MTRLLFAYSLPLPAAFSTLRSADQVAEPWKFSLSPREHSKLCRGQERMRLTWV